MPEAKPQRVIPLADLAAQHETLDSEIMDALTRVIGSGSFIRGPDVAAFEIEFAELHGIKHAIGVASGTSALCLAVQALDLQPGDEVVTVPNTWISTAFAASLVGARPVFVDIDPQTYQVDPAKLEEALTSRTKAVIAVHMFGHPAPLGAIEDLCRPRNIRIVEDVAQAPLARSGGRLTGTVGDLGCFSFYPSKNIGSYGDGGMIITDDDHFAERVRLLANYGQAETHVHEIIGYNSRLDTLQAAILRCKLPHLPTWNEARRKTAAAYAERLAGLPVQLPTTAPDAVNVFHLYVIQLMEHERAAVLAYLRDHGVMAQVHYHGIVHLQPCYQELGYREGDFPVAENAVRNSISLPIYPEMTIEQVDYVASVLRGALKNTASSGTGRNEAQAS